MSAVAEGVREIILAKTKSGRSEVNDSDWLDELGVDSLEMIFELEERFKSWPTKWQDQRTVNAR
jgi:acyl carrier protein